MSVRIQTAALVLAIITPALVQAQWVGVVRGWFSTPGCESNLGLDSLGMGDAVYGEDGETPKLAARIYELEQSLPEGRARHLARELVTSLNPKNHLKYVCKDKTETGYAIRYPSDLKAEHASDTEVTELHYETGNLGHPKIKFDVKFEAEKEVFCYSYKLSNGINATRPISRWYMMSEERRSIDTNRKPHKLGE